MPILKTLRKKTKAQHYREWQQRKREAQAERFRKTLNRIYWGRFFLLLRPHRSRITIIISLVVISSFIGLVIPHAARFILDVVVPQRNLTLLHWVALLALAAYGLHALLRYCEQRLVYDLSLTIVTQIRQELLRHQLSLPISYFEKYSTGKLISKLTYSVSMVKMLIERFGYICVRELVMMTMIVVAALLIDFKLTLIFLMLLPFLVFYLRRLNAHMVLVSERLQTKNDEIMRLLDRAFHSFKLFQIFGEGEQELKRFGKTLLEDKHFRLKRTLVYVKNSILFTFLSSAVVLIALWYGGRQIIVGQLSYGDVLGYLICLMILFRPVADFVRAVAYFQAGKVGVRTIFAVFDHSSPILEPAKPLKPLVRRGALEFCNVWFNYGNGGGGLRNVSFQVAPGQKVLIVGRSGSGKTTLFNLLLRFYECERGSIKVDGVSIRRMALSDLRSYFSVVSQDQLYCEDSLLNNILLGDVGGNEDPDRRLERAIELAHKTGMSDFITSLDRKYGEKIGQAGAGGRGFSQGELQRLAIARATSRTEAPIVLLDEPLAALDHFSQRELVAIIQEQFAGKTLLMISHAPIPFLKPDWILVLREGRLDNQGAHPYLFRHSNYYRNLLGKSQGYLHYH